MQSIVEVRGEEGCGEGGPVRPFAGGVAEFEVGEGGVPVGQEGVGEGEAVPVEHDVVDELVDGELDALGDVHSSESEDHAVYRRRHAGSSRRVAASSRFSTRRWRGRSRWALWACARTRRAAWRRTRASLSEILQGHLRRRLGAFWRTARVTRARGGRYLPSMAKTNTAGAGGGQAVEKAACTTAIAHASAAATFRPEHCRTGAPFSPRRDAAAVPRPPPRIADGETESLI